MFYDPISSYGDDRLALLYYIVKNFEDKPVFAIDSGTAITIDTMYKKQYFGGSIFAGFYLALKALFLNTKQLPLLSEKKYMLIENIEKYKNNSFGFSTEQSILSGLYSSYSGFIINSFNNFCNKINKIENSKNINPIILITGGDSKLIYDLINEKLNQYEIVIDENAVLKGLYYFYQSDQY